MKTPTWPRLPPSVRVCHVTCASARLSPVPVIYPETFHLLGVSFHLPVGPASRPSLFPKRHHHLPPTTSLSSTCSPSSVRALCFWSRCHANSPLSRVPFQKLWETLTQTSQSALPPAGHYRQLQAIRNAVCFVCPPLHCPTPPSPPSPGRGRGGGGGGNNSVGADVAVVIVPSATVYLLKCFCFFPGISEIE